MPETTVRVPLPTDKQARKERPIARGVLDYFPNAIAEVAFVSYVGNQQHNPGEPMHWAREKSADHADCIERHLIERGTIDTDGTRHTAKLAWRALALLQEELEEAAAKPADIPVELSTTNFGVPASWRDFERAKDEHCIIELGCKPEVAKQIAAGITYGVRPDCKDRFVYIAGPMRGYDKFNFPSFDAARVRFVQNGWNVISPADIDRNAGCTENTPPDQVQDQRAFVYRDFFALYAIAHTEGGAIAMIPGWEKSTGAVGEFFLARWLGLKILDADTMLPLDDPASHGVEGDDLINSSHAFLHGQLEK